MAKTSVNIPLTDDYDAIADFLYRYVHTPASCAYRLDPDVAAQSVQADAAQRGRRCFSTTSSGTQTTEHCSCSAICPIPATLWLLWLLLARQQRPFQQAIWLFLIPWYLFLSLNYLRDRELGETGSSSSRSFPSPSPASSFFTSSDPPRHTLGNTLSHPQYREPAPTVSSSPSRF